MIKPHMTIAEAWYKVNVEGLNPGLSLEEAIKTSEKISEQYKDVVAASTKMQNSLGNRRGYPGYTG